MASQPERKTNNSFHYRVLPIHLYDVHNENFDFIQYTRWFKYDRDYLYINKSQFVPVIFEPPFIYLACCERINIEIYTGICVGLFTKCLLFLCDINVKEI
jgi:hypothetical protein